MDIEEFKQNRIEGRRKLLEKIIDIFKSMDPLAIHQFGSGVTGFRDEFSDIDIWITFKDSEIKNILPKLNKVYKSVAPILVRHHSKSWSPVGGSADQVIHDTNFGLFIVDYYVSKISETSMPENSIPLYGNNMVNKGEWKINKNLKDSHDLKNDVNQLLNTIFISVKGIVRKLDSPDFVNNLIIIHQKFRKRHRHKIKRRKITLSFKFDYRLLADLYNVSNKTQKKAIDKIKSCIQQIEKLYVVKN